MARKPGFAVLMLTVMLGAMACLSAPDVLIIGDSVMQGAAPSIKKEFHQKYGIEPASFTSIGTGLARADLFDWNAKLVSLMKEVEPEIVLCMMGGNDNQPMKEEGRVLNPTTKEWAVEYQRRIQRILDTMFEGKAQLVVLIGNPDMRDPLLQHVTTVINGIYQSAAENSPNVVFFDTRPLLSKKKGEYSSYIIRENGMPLQVRTTDGSHLNLAGANLLAKHLVPEVMTAYRQQIEKSAAQ